MASANTGEHLNMSQQKTILMGLRTQLMLGSTLIFTGVFAAAFFWFYSFTTSRALTRLKEDLVATTQGAAAGVDADELLALYREGEPGLNGQRSKDPRYENQVAWLDTVHTIEPRAWLLVFVLGNQPDTRRAGEPVEQDEIIYVVDMMWNHAPEDAIDFLQPTQGTSYHLKAIEQGKTTIRPLYDDAWGSWMSAYSPVKNENGEIVAAVGVDFEAGYVREIQRQIRNRFGMAFAVTYSVLIAMVFLLSEALTKRLKRLKDVAEKVGEGDYSQNIAVLHQKVLQDEISVLAQILSVMTEKVRDREESLRRQVTNLKVEIDQAKRWAQVQEIVDTDFFRDLQVKAKLFRQQCSRSSNRKP
jgi:HAMP domain-containing protein